MSNANITAHLRAALADSREALEHATDAAAYDELPELATAPLDVAIGELKSVVRWLEAAVEADEEAA